MKNEEDSILNKEMIIINLGLIQFAESLKAQDVDVVHVNWTPPAGGDKEMIDLLDKLI